MSMPEPDIVVAPPTSEDYVPLESIALAIEVSDSTLPYDLGRKAALYARNGVPEYWVVDLAETTVHQFWSVSAEGFSHRRSLPLAGAVPSATLPDLVIDGTGLV